MARPRIVIVGGGFAGYHCARRLSRLSRGQFDITLVNPTDYFLYLPLLPQVTGGLLDPRRVTVSIPATLPHVGLRLGQVRGIDLDARRVEYVDLEDRSGNVGYDRLVIAVGSVNRLLPVPGIDDYAHGFRGIPEALYLRDHLVRQIELAEAADDPHERAARLTFVVAGAGYTGTEVLAHGERMTRSLLRSRPALAGERCRWLLVDTADRVLPGLDPRLSAATARVLRRRGVDIRLGTSVQKATADGIQLSDASFVATRTLAWCVGVRPDPLVEGVHLPTRDGRLVVDEYLSVPGHPEVFACGDAAAVEDVTMPGKLTPMTAQHAERQGKLVAINIAAEYGRAARRTYEHHDLGFVVDLAGVNAAANPFGVPLSGLPAAAVTGGYHLLSLPANRVRVTVDWLLGAFSMRQFVQLGLIRSGEVPLDSAMPEYPSRRR
ncbi:MAG TPA: NAD(P)/FAD-dependent oxidoreductase [Micromonosporaceae bacterium]|nr:NAD(P)/FAD-dependent oxidoreductase [Micromonosporaceae bacterium]